ncbi:uncharacterized protein N7483_006323 [Penicillium malachiteum]|uniref:uncharacterized protein n=1 Tax=Penicillium malachiteum TaxID=1324776 RepID=UPI002548A20E|nr:uncharacterized protein N7483_006323 [Penicillium malachiteum]KAJ5724966.1 hypothetical protein N7483_006323 [Penicillium malachiteum]
MLTAIIGWLGDEITYVRDAVLAALEDQQNLSPDVLTMIVGLLVDANNDVCGTAFTIITHQKDLSLDALTAIVGRLGDEHPFVRKAALQALQDQQNLPLDAVIRSGETLYRNLLEITFEFNNNIHWCISDETLTMTFDSQTLQFQDHSMVLEDMLSEVRRWCGHFNLRDIMFSDNTHTRKIRRGVQVTDA